MTNTTETHDAPEVGGIDATQLRGIVERIERLEEEKADLGQDIRDLYLEAKGNGFDPKIIRKIIRLRRMDARDVDEEEVLIHLYKRAVGMVA